MLFYRVRASFKELIASKYPDQPHKTAFKKPILVDGFATISRT